MRETELVKALRALDERPGMYLLDRRYGALVAYILGWLAGARSKELEGFQDWVALQTTGSKSPIHWSAIIAIAENRRARSGSRH